MSDKNRPMMGVGVTTGKTPVAKSEQSAGALTNPDSPFCIAVMGDFSGRGNQLASGLEIKPLANSRFIDVDRDNFEEIIASFKISLKLHIGDDIVEVNINELDDFHPDELYENLESFSRLRSLRRRLKSNKTFSEAAEEIQSWLPVKQEGKELTENNTEASASIEAPSDNLLDDILGSHQQTAGSTSSEATHIDKLIRSIVAPYVEPAKDPRQDEMLVMLDVVTANHMRDILHHDDFQALESAWQSLYFLIKRLDTDSKLKIILLDVSKQELQADLAVDDISTSVMYKKFCDRAEGDLPWSVLLGNYQFSDSIDDVLSLANIGAIAEQAGAPFLSSANERLAGCESFSTTPDYEDWQYEISTGTRDAWKMLRQSSVASFIGLALPRFLLRLPYGKKSKPVESFQFEEMPEQHCHECYLWGNAAFLKVELMARNFKKQGWNMQLREEFQTDNLPVHYYTDDGETVSKPVAEVYLTEKAGEILNNSGLMTLWSVKNMDSIRSAGYDSVDENSLEISGRWQ